MAKTLLFSPAALRSLDLPNRIVVSPMGQFSADPEGFAMPWHQVHLGNLALSGAGLVIVEATAVEARGRASYRCLGLWDDAHVANMREIVAFCRTHGSARIGIQLSHMGRKGSDRVPWERDKGLDAYGGGWQMVAPSAVAYPGRPEPSALDADGLRAVRTAFVRAASRADAAGFDLLEIHNGHGYLLHSFLSPHSNHRTDGYGGGRDARMRFPLEVFSAVRDAWPSEKPLGVRVSASDWTEAGWQVDDAVAFAAKLRELGCDYVCASSGGSSPDQRIHANPGYQVPFAAAIRRDAHIPTMAVGLITEPQQAEDVLRDGAADFIAVGRAMLHDPRWAVHAAEHFGEEVTLPGQYARVHPSAWTGRAIGP